VPALRIPHIPHCTSGGDLHSAWALRSVAEVTLQPPLSFGGVPRAIISEERVRLFSLPLTTASLGWEVITSGTN
jgi:hypothetical protein